MTYIECLKSSNRILEIRERPKIVIGRKMVAAVGRAMTSRTRHFVPWQHCFSHGDIFAGAFLNVVVNSLLHYKIVLPFVNSYLITIFLVSCKRSLMCSHIIIEIKCFQCTVDVQC
jgi:hypothetical protein